METFTVKTDKDCIVCKSPILGMNKKASILEHFRVVSGGGGGGKAGGAHPFWQTAESIGFSCPGCGLVYNFEKTTDRKKLDAILFKHLSSKREFLVKEDWYRHESDKKDGLPPRLYKDQKVFFVPELSGLSSSQISHSPNINICESPDIGADRYRVPRSLLEELK